MSNELKFLNNSVDYSEEYVIKNVLYKYIETYNMFLYNYNSKLNLSDKDSNIIIPNNNKKYYLFIQKKNTKNTTLFFFPDLISKKYFNDFLLIKNTIEEFFIECDIRFDDNSYLLEGYIYENEGKKHFLISDILFKGDMLIECSYEYRFNMIKDLFYKRISVMENINNLLSIGIHNYISEDILPIFLNNFKWREQIICIEYINNFEKNKKLLSQKNKTSNNALKKVIKSKISDIYNVYNIDTNNFEGYLYINTIKMSKYISSLFKNNDVLKLECSFNTYFQKWQIDKTE